MIDYFNEPWVDEEDPRVWCRECGEEAELNDQCQIECPFCGKTSEWLKLIGDEE